MKSNVFFSLIVLLTNAGPTYASTDVESDSKITGSARVPKIGLEGDFSASRGNDDGGSIKTRSWKKLVAVLIRARLNARTRSHVLPAARRCQK